LNWLSRTMNISQRGMLVAQLSRRTPLPAAWDLLYHPPFSRAVHHLPAVVQEVVAEVLPVVVEAEEAVVAGS
jgi:hypothetical protein